MTSESDEFAMRLALDQAHNAWLVGEVPVGAVIVRRNGDAMQVVATGYNRPIDGQPDPWDPSDPKFGGFW